MNEITSLENTRKKIDEIDEAMAVLFKQRMAAAEDVVAYKLQNNLPVFDAAREEIVIQKNVLRLNDEKLQGYYTEFITDIMDISKQYQKSIANAGLIGYQGTKGAFSHIAATRIFSGSELKSYKTFEQIFLAIEENEIAFGVIPFENSYTGEVGEVFDLLFQHDCKISEIFDLKINQNLLAVRGAKIEEIRQVYSHHQALSQCQSFFDDYPNCTLIPYPNTALAAEFVSHENDKTKAAIASIETAKLYGLDVLAENINTSAENTTRFIVITKNLIKHGNRFNIMFTLKHDAGQLASAMQIIAAHGFNMESIKSRPIRNLPWQYYFYAEIDGNAFEAKALKMIDELKQKCSALKLIGAYITK